MICKVINDNRTPVSQVDIGTCFILVGEDKQYVYMRVVIPGSNNSGKESRIVNAVVIGMPEWDSQPNPFGIVQEFSFNQEVLIVIPATEYFAFKIDS